jgi:fatty acid desaturase
MAQAAPAPSGTSRQTRTPDIFSARVHRAAKWAVPVVLGLVYGYWAAANRRHGGEITGWNLLFGFVTAIAFMVLYVAVRALAPRMRRELHALLWFAFAGSAIGFLYNQAGATVPMATVMGLVVGAGFFLVLFYRYSTHEEAEGRRTD